MERIFVVFTSSQLRNSDMLEVNKFLKENPYCTVKSIVPVTQHNSSGNYGVVITVGKR